MAIDIIPHKVDSFKWLKQPFQPRMQDKSDYSLDMLCMHPVTANESTNNQIQCWKVTEFASYLFRAHVLENSLRTREQ